MKNNSTLALLCLTAGISAACAPTQTDPGYPYTVQVVEMTGVTGDEGTATFGLVNRTLQTLRSLDNVDGDYAKIVFGGALSVKAINGSIIQSDKFEGGTKPPLRYKVSNGTVIARDYPTLAILSAYYQFETIFLNLQKVTGLKMDEMIATLPGNKFNSLFEPQITIDVPGESGSQSAKLNAAFVPTQKAFVLFRRSPIEKLPLATNLQVLSHEFGHAIFQKTFYKDSSDQDERMANEYAMRGINEGFADFNSYNFTGSTDVLRGSIDIALGDRNVADERDFKRTTFTFTQFDDTADLDSGLACTQSFYCIGTIFARSLLKIENTLNTSGAFAKAQFHPAFITALRTTQDDMLKATGLPAAPAQSELGKRSKDYDPKILGIFLNSLIGQMPKATQAAMCAEFISESEFGARGFPVAYRTNCGS